MMAMVTASARRRERRARAIDRREPVVPRARERRRGGRILAMPVEKSGADETRVAHWLAPAADAPGCRGFAVGRTLWFDDLRRQVRAELDRAEAASAIASRYGALIDTDTRSAAA
jgi:myo-inositol catabolism protein IolC